MDCYCCGGKSDAVCRVLLSEGNEKSVLLCGKCGSAFVAPMPSGEELSACYPPAYYDDFIKKYWKDFYKGRRLGKYLKTLAGDGVFLDIGGAIGTMAAGVREESGWRVGGTEFSQISCSVAKAVNNVDFSAAPAGVLPFDDASADFIHANNIIEHMRSPSCTLREFRRVLRPGGRLRLCLPNGPVDLLPNIILWRKHGRAFRTRHGGHIFFFSKEGISSLLGECGFGVVSCRNFHFKPALKCHGLTHNAFRAFLRAPAAQTVRPSRSAAELKAAIPKPCCRFTDDMLARWRALWRFDGPQCGADYEIEAVRLP